MCPQGDGEGWSRRGKLPVFPGVMNSSEFGEEMDSRLRGNDREKGE